MSKETLRRRKPNLRGLDEGLGDDERDHLFWASHWLAFDWEATAKPEPAETVNLFLLALWLVRPTPTRVRIRFEVKTDPNDAPGARWHLLDQFGWVPGTVGQEVTDADLQECALLLPALSSVHLRAGRLLDALGLTLAGCTTSRWSVALISYAAAAEALLTYATGRGITSRLALAYACLVEADSQARGRAYLEFKEFYKGRSDVMHGRLYNLAVADRLPLLSRSEYALRRLWKTILRSAPTLQTLENTDSQREVFFRQLQGSLYATALNAPARPSYRSR